MNLRPLGRSGLQVSPLCFGGNVFGWTADEPTSFSLLDAFVAGGGNLIDTADSYSRWAPGHLGGESETVIGRWIAQRGRHDDVIIATKVGSDMGLGYKCLKRDYIVRAVEDSLRRLQVDAIKIDRAFVEGLGRGDPGNSAIADAITQIGRALSLTVVAEAVATEAQLQMVRDLGCDMAQGFLIAPPLDVEKATDFVRGTGLPDLIR